VGRSTTVASTLHEAGEDVISSMNVGAVWNSVNRGYLRVTLALTWIKKDSSINRLCIVVFQHRIKEAAVCYNSMCLLPSYPCW